MDKPGRPFHMSAVGSAGFVLDYADAGPSDPEAVIVSLPGSAGIEMSTAKDRLAQRYRVIEINPPGWGSRTDVDRPMPQSEIGKILAEAVVQLVDGPFVVIGTSMGGANAMHLTAQLPERVAGVILEGSMAPASPNDLRMPPPDPSGRPDEVDTAAYPEPTGHPSKPWATREYVAEQMANRMRMFQLTEPDMTAESAILSVDWTKVPVLALLGSADEILRPTVETAIRAAFPRVQFHLVHGGWHDLQNTAADEFVDLVHTFISGNCRLTDQIRGQ